ncbi:MAG TPA: hypothetical protein VGL56_08830 [Fimbriimonadaceae bacterium]
MLITGFGPFGEIAKNPSQWLAENLGLPFEIIPVSYAATDAFVERTAANPPERILHIGVARKATKFRVELVAHNLIGPTPDIDGIVAGPGPIDPAADQQLGTTLWKSPGFFQENENWETSVNAGDYLCNYIYFQSLKSLSNTEIGFLHVPPEEAMPLPMQLKIAREILNVMSVNTGLTLKS